jgi:DNA primase
VSRIVESCAAALWTDAGARARAWLNARGLEDGTLEHWRIGYNPADRHIAGLYVDRGIVIPCQADGRTWYVKVRRPMGEPKYRKVRGSRTGLFGAATFQDQQVAVLTEGEFDAMLLWQAARDLAAIGTLGSAGDRIDLAVWARYLLPVPVWLIAYDADEAGARGAAWWTEFSGRPRRIAVPRLREGDKDITDFWKAGGNLRDWLAFAVAVS